VFENVFFLYLWYWFHPILIEFKMIVSIRVGEVCSIMREQTLFLAHDQFFSWFQFQVCHVF
jgi:hypothetical protein